MAQHSLDTHMFTRRQGRGRAPGVLHWGRDSVSRAQVSSCRPAKKPRRLPVGFASASTKGKPTTRLLGPLERGWDKQEHGEQGTQGGGAGAGRERPGCRLGTS